MHPDDLAVLSWVSNGGDPECRPEWMLASLDQIDHWWWMRDRVAARAPRYDLSPAEEAIDRADRGYTLPWHPSTWDKVFYDAERARRQEQDVADAHEFELYRVDLAA